MQLLNKVDLQALERVEKISTEIANLHNIEEGSEAETLYRKWLKYNSWSISALSPEQKAEYERDMAVIAEDKKKRAELRESLENQLKNDPEIVMAVLKNAIIGKGLGDKDAVQAATLAPIAVMEIISTILDSDMCENMGNAFKTIAIRSLNAAADPDIHLAVAQITRARYNALLETGFEPFEALQLISSQPIANIVSTIGSSLTIGRK